MFKGYTKLRTWPTCLSVGLIVCVLCPAVGVAQSEFDPQKHHRWARFAPGAWSRVSEVAETFDEEGRLIGSSTTETTTRLVSKDERSVTLHTEANIEVAGKRFDSPPRDVKQGVYGEVNGNSATVEDAGAGSVTISDQRIPCQVRRVTTSDSSSKSVTTIYFNDQIAPYELRRETVCTDLQAKTLKYQTNVEVIAINLPFSLLSEIQTVALVKTVHSSAEGKRVTVEVHCPRIPGGVVAHWSKELDERGRLKTRSVKELTDYSLTDADAQRVPEGRGLFHRRPR